jgi:hypothetical protein
MQQVLHASTWMRQARKAPVTGPLAVAVGLQVHTVECRRPTLRTGARFPCDPVTPCGFQAVWRRPSRLARRPATFGVGARPLSE